MNVGASHHLQADARIVYFRLKSLDARAHVRPFIVVYARRHVRRAGNHSHALCDGDARHLQRLTHIPGAVVNARQQMTMQINQVVTSNNNYWNNRLSS
jgi:hypothetical protein